MPSHLIFLVDDNKNRKQIQERAQFCIFLWFLHWILEVLPFWFSFHCYISNYFSISCERITKRLQLRQ